MKITVVVEWFPGTVQTDHHSTQPVCSLALSQHGVQRHLVDIFITFQIEPRFMICCITPTVQMVEDLNV